MSFASKSTAPALAACCLTSAPPLLQKLSRAAAAELQHAWVLAAAEELHQGRHGSWSPHRDACIAAREDGAQGSSGHA
jgi:hypothetical protein